MEVQVKPIEEMTLEEFQAWFLHGDFGVSLSEFEAQTQDCEDEGDAENED